MKKILLLLPCLLLGLTACKKTAQTPDGATSDTLTMDSVQCHDSIILDSANAVRIDLKACYAISGPQALTDSINTWICQWMGDSLASYRDSIPALMTIHAMEWLNEYGTQAREEFDTRDNADYGVNYAYDLRIEPVYEDEDYLSMTCTTYLYTNGAHGGVIIEGVTFDRKDGHQLGYELLQGMSEEELMAAIRRGLMENFDIKEDLKGEDGSVITTEQQLNEVLFEPNIGLPEAPPYLTSQGVVLTYQQYEIAPYACGMPTVIIPRQKGE